MSQRNLVRTLWNQKSFTTGTYYTPLMTFGEFVNWAVQLDPSGTFVGTWDLQASVHPALQLAMPSFAQQPDSNSVPGLIGYGTPQWVSLLSSTYALSNPTASILTTFSNAAHTAVRGVLVVSSGTAVVSSFAQGVNV